MLRSPNILLVTQFFPPETGAGARRVGALADGLAERFDLTVLAPAPGYPSPELFDQDDGREADRQRPYTIVRTFEFSPPKGSLLLRGLVEALFSARLAFAALRFRTDLILVSTPSMFLAPALWLVAKLKRVPFVWDVRDLTWRYSGAVEGASAAHAVASRVLSAVMTPVLRRAERVVAATPGVARLLAAEHGVREEQLVTLVNGVSAWFAEKFENPPSFSGSGRTVLYLGLLGHNHGVGVLTEVARLLPDFKFLIVGDGPERDRMAAEVSEKGLTNVELAGYTTDENEIIEYYRRADILFNQTRDRKILNETVLSAKLFEYMAVGKPIVYAGHGLAASFLREAGCAAVVPPHDPPAIAEALRRLTADKAKMHKMGAAGRELVTERYVREDLVDQFVADLHGWLSDSPGGFAGA